MRHQLFFAVISCVLAALIARPVAAAEFYPTALRLGREKPVTTLRIRNNETTRKTYELTGFRWNQQNGRDVLTSDKNFIVTPPILRLEPDQEAIVRVGLLTVDDAVPSEQAYRLVVDDITPRAKSEGETLSLRIRMVLPVFLAATTPGASVAFTPARVENGRVCIAGQNNGDSHAQAVWIAYGQTPQKKISAFQYFLAGASADICTDALPPNAVSRPIIIGLTSGDRSSVTPHEVQPGNDQETSAPRE